MVLGQGSVVRVVAVVLVEVLELELALARAMARVVARAQAVVQALALALHQVLLNEFQVVASLAQVTAVVDCRHLVQVDWGSGD